MRRLDSFGSAVRRLAAWASTPGGLGWLFGAGLLVRLWLARGAGFPYDMASFRAWADRLATLGPGRFYADPGYFIDYPPGYMYVLFVLGKVSRALFGSAPSDLLLKMPPIAADLGLAWVALRLGARVLPEGVRRRVPWQGPVAAAILLNPAVIFVSAVWGQADSVLALLVAGAVLAVGGGGSSALRELSGMALVGAAVAVKPQGAFVAPFVGLLVAWRHLRRGLASERRARALAAGALRVVAAVGFSAGVWLLAALPFGMGPAELVRFYLKSAGTYKYTSVWAFNLWGAVGFWRPESRVRLGGIPALWAGLALFAAGAAAVAWRMWRSLRGGEEEGRALGLGAVAAICVAFAVLTRIHERYLFLAVALLAPFAAQTRLRRALVALSGLYFLNVYFPWVYYVTSPDVGRRTLVIRPLFDLVYGTAQDSAQKKVLSLLTAALCVVVALRGWRWLREPPPAPLEAKPELVVAGDGGRPAARRREPVRLGLHPVGRRGALLGLAVFALALAIRLPGLASPPGMYFDEVYHARTAGEYIQHREVYEWTHPPLAKELIAVGITTLSSFGVVGTGPAPPGMGGVVASDGERVVWASVFRDGAFLRTGRFGGGCGVEPRGGAVRLRVLPAVIAPAAGGAVVGGEGPEGPVLVRVAGGTERWRAVLPSPPQSLALLDQTSFVVGSDGSLVMVSPEGVPRTVASGAVAVSAASEEGLVWVAFPDRRAVAAFGPDGAERYAVQLQDRPSTLLALPPADRVLVATGRGIESVDSETKVRVTEELVGPVPDRLATIPETGLAWAVKGRRVQVIEPRGLAVIGRTSYPVRPQALVADRDNVRLDAVAGGRMACAGGQPTFAWRLPSALFGSAAAALAALVALRCFGSMAAAALAGGFVGLDGLAYTMSRIAMNDSFVTAFILAAWFCALSARFLWGGRASEDGWGGRAPGEGWGGEAPEGGVGRGRRSRLGALAWLGGAAVASGLAVASKWVGLYALGGIGLLVLADALWRGREGLGGLLGHPLVTLAVLGLAFVVIPVGIYLFSYIPYFRLGHSLSELWALQKQMYGYHAHLTATHPYGSPWYGWPIGRRAVWLYLGTHGDKQAEIWTLANPVVFLGGLAGLGALAAAAWRRREVALGVVPFAALVQYLPWTMVSRVTFLYHYLPDVPFLAIGLGWWLAVGRKGARRQGLEMLVAVGAAVAAFAFMLPMIDGWFVSRSYLQLVRAWLSWMF